MKLLCGIGINDANYKVKPVIRGSGGKRLICPFYQAWKNMITRVYDPSHIEKHPSYFGHSVCEEWLTFSNFKSWMEVQDWEGKTLDKDLLVFDNKVYSPETCIFVSEKVNKFMTEKQATNKGLPIGVYIRKDTGKFRACVSDLTGKTINLGQFEDAESAGAAYAERKALLAKELASQELDERVAQALLKRYCK